MSKCELCGQEADSLKKVKIEGAKLKVCNSCSDMGEEIKTSSRTRKKKKSRSSKSRQEKVLVQNYGKKVKQAREDEQLSIQEMSDELNEKTSLLSKVEKEDLKPDKSLARKLSKRLDIQLYTNPKVNNYNQSSSADQSKATLEDVADIKD